MSRITLRLVFAIVGAIGLYAAISVMVRLPGRIDVAIAALAVLAFSYCFERDEDERSPDRSGGLPSEKP